MAKSEIYNNESLHKAERKEMIRECRKDKMKIMAEKILIITGGTVDYEWAKDWLSAKTYDYCIAADSGLVHADKLGIRVDYILGDYDSVNERLLDTYKKDTQTVTYPPEKNYTDTHLAVITALKHHPAAIDILGATGTRYDHALTNIFIMKQALEAGTLNGIGIVGLGAAIDFINTYGIDKIREQEMNLIEIFYKKIQNHKYKQTNHTGVK